MRQEELNADQAMIQISEKFREYWIALEQAMDDHPGKVDWQNAEKDVIAKLSRLEKDLLNVETRLQELLAKALQEF